MSTTPTDVTNPDVQHTDADGRARTWLKPDQVDRLRDVCLTDAVPTYLQDRNEAIIALLYDAGLRAGEVCALDVDHLDLDAGTVYLPSRIQKGSPPPATLGLAADTVRLLRRYLRDRWKDTDALFPTRSSDRLTTRSLQRLVGVRRVRDEGDRLPVGVVPTAGEFANDSRRRLQWHRWKSAPAVKNVAERAASGQKVDSYLTPWFPP